MLLVAPGLATRSQTKIKTARAQKRQGVQAVVSCPWTNEDGLTTGEARRDAFSCTCRPNFNPLSHPC